MLERYSREVVESAPEVLSSDVIAKLLVMGYGPGVHAIAVVGSAARGDTTWWSDIDVHSYVRLPSQRWATRVRYVGERLVMVASDTIAAVRAELHAPDRAIWAVPALRDMRILLDQERQLTALRDEATAFEWASMREPAEAWTRSYLVRSVELVHKIAAAKERADESAALHAAVALAGRCARAVVTARGSFVRSENEYFRVAQRTAGEDWTRLHRLALGLGPGDAFDQATSSWELFVETARVLRDVLDDEARVLIEPALAASR